MGIRHENNQAHCKKFYKALAKLIAPLEVRDADYGHTACTIWHNGKRVGSIRQCYGGGWYSSSERFLLESPRIPSRSRYGDGSRQYQKVESMAKAVKRYCYADTDLEKLAEQISKARNEAQRRVERHRIRWQSLLNQGGVKSSHAIVEAMDDGAIDALEPLYRALLWKRVARRMEPVLKAWYQPFVDADVAASGARYDEKETMEQSA